MNHSRIRRSVALALCLGVLSGSLALAPWGGTAWAQTSVSSTTLDAARALYQESKFTEAITQLRQGLASGSIQGADVRGARELLARCLVRAGNRIEAKEAFKGVLRMNPAYRPDAATVPPDEQEVFQMALREVTAEQIEAGDRVPASISMQFGVGSGANEDIAEVFVPGGGDGEFENQAHFGGAVRFPLTPRLSLEIELQRFRATGSDTLDPANPWEVSALPLSLNLHYAALTQPRYRLQLFAGAGPLLAANAKVTIANFLGSGTDIAISDQRTGVFFQGGVEGEFLATPRVGLYARLGGRAAKAEIFPDDDLDLYTSDNSLKGREVDFTGFSASFGLRAYIGY